MNAIKAFASFIHGSTNYVIIILLSVCVHFFIQFENRLFTTEKQCNDNKAYIDVVNTKITDLQNEVTKHEADDKFFATINKH